MVNYELCEQRVLRQILQNYFPSPVRNPRILDIYCGTINEKPLLLEHFGENSHIVSISYDPLDHGNRKDLCNLAVLGRFDLVIGRDIHLDDNGQWQGIFKKIANYMNPESELFLTFCLPNQLDAALEILCRDYIYTKIEMSPVRSCKDNFVLIAMPGC